MTSDYQRLESENVARLMAEKAAGRPYHGVISERPVVAEVEAAPAAIEVEVEAVELVTGTDQDLGEGEG